MRREAVILGVVVGLMGLAGCAGGGAQQGALSVERDEGAVQGRARQQRQQAATPAVVNAPAPAPTRQVVQEPQPAAVAEPARAPEPVFDAEGWRPGWWVGQGGGAGGVERRAGGLVSAAMGTDGDLLRARRAAVEAAAAGLERALGGRPGETATKVDTLQLPDGRYRAFVLMSVSSER